MKSGPLPDDANVDAAVALFAAIAHPVRLVVLHALSRSGELTAGELQELAGVEQTSMSHQLRTLREARLVTAERSGRFMIYRLRDHHVAHVIKDAFAHVAE